MTRTTTVVLVRPPATGGLLSHMRDETKLLRERGVRTVDSGPFPARLDADSSVDTPIREGLSPFSAFLAIRGLRSTMRREKKRGNCAVHAHGVRAAALAALASIGMDIRVVTTLHNAPPCSGVDVCVSWMLHRIACSLSNYVLAVSPDLQDLARAHGARRATRAVIPGGTEGATVKDQVQDSGERSFLRVLVLARLAPQKGLDSLFDALHIMRTQHDVSLRFTVEIAGHGPLHDHLAERIAAENLPVTLLGHRHDIPELLARADLVVQPSMWEGQPVAIQEALRAHKAIIATDAGGTRWVTSDAALLVPPSAPQELAGALACLLVAPDAAQHRAALEERAAMRARELPTMADLDSQLCEVLTLEP